MKVLAGLVGLAAALSAAEPAVLAQVGVDATGNLRLVAAEDPGAGGATTAAPPRPDTTIFTTTAEVPTPAPTPPAVRYAIESGAFQGQYVTERDFLADGGESATWEAFELPGGFPAELMGCDSPVVQTKCMSKKQYQDVFAGVAGLVAAKPEGDFAACVLRAVGHDMLDFDEAGGKSGTPERGGVDACLDLRAAGNRGLAECFTQLKPEYLKVCSEISLADFMVIAAEAVMGTMRQAAPVSVSELQAAQDLTDAQDAEQLAQDALSAATENLDTTSATVAAAQESRKAEAARLTAAATNASDAQGACREALQDLEVNEQFYQKRRAAVTLTQKLADAQVKLQEDLDFAAHKQGNLTADLAAAKAAKDAASIGATEEACVDNHGLHSSENGTCAYDPAAPHGASEQTNKAALKATNATGKVAFCQAFGAACNYFSPTADKATLQHGAQVLLGRVQAAEEKLRAVEQEQEFWTTTAGERAAQLKDAQDEHDALLAAKQAAVAADNATTTKVTAKEQECATKDEASRTTAKLSLEFDETHRTQTNDERAEIESLSHAVFVAKAAHGDAVHAREQAAFGVQDEQVPTLDFANHFRFGRKTAQNCTWAAGRFPDPAKGCRSTRDVMYNLGVPWRGAAALFGVHGVGRARAANSGYDGWFGDPAHRTELGNSYFTSIVANGWKATPGVGAGQGEEWSRSDAGAPKEIRLATDMCIAYDTASEPGCCAWRDAEKIPEVLRRAAGTWSTPSVERSVNDTIASQRSTVCGAGEGPNCDPVEAPEIKWPQTAQGFDDVVALAESTAAFLKELRYAWYMASAAGNRELTCLPDKCSDAGEPAWEGPPPAEGEDPAEAAAAYAREKAREGCAPPPLLGYSTAALLERARRTVGKSVSTPTPAPTRIPTMPPVAEDMGDPTPHPTSAPTPTPTRDPTVAPTPVPTESPTPLLPAPVPTPALHTRGWQILHPDVENYPDEWPGNEGEDTDPP